MENYAGNLFQSVAACSISFLQNKSPLLQQLKKTFPIIGKAADVDRVYVFKNYLLDSGDKKSLIMSHFAEWCSEGIEPQLENRNVTGLDYYPDCVELLKEFKRGYPWIMDKHNANGINKNLCKLLTDQGIHSVVLAPIIVENNLWGFAGFDYCKEDKFIRPPDISAVVLYATLIAASLSRYSQEMDILACMTSIANTYNALLDRTYKANDENVSLADNLIKSELNLDIKNYLERLEKNKAKLKGDLLGTYTSGVEDKPS